MTERVANLNDYDLGALDAFTDVISKLSEIVDGGPKYDFHRLFYSTLIQSGVHSIRLFGTLPSQIADSRFLRRRTLVCSPAKLMNEEERIRERLTANLVTDTVGFDDERNISVVSRFLANLTFAASTRRAMVSTLGIPRLQELEGVVHPDVLIVVDHLFAAIETVSVPSPVPKLEVPARAVRQLDDVLGSDLFNEYCRSQEGLANGEVATASASVRLKNSAVSLARRFREVVTVRQTLLRMLPVTKALVDTVAGSIGEAVTDSLGSALSGLLQENRRVVVYSFHDVFEGLYTSRLKRIRELLDKEKEASE